MAAPLVSADLEISIHRWDVDQYAVELRFSQPKDDADVRLLPGPVLAQFPLENLAALENDAKVYGQTLAACLFADPSVKMAFSQAWSVTQALDIPLRVRLLIGANAPELHSLRWEALRLPLDSELLLSHERLFFSRYLSSGDWRPITLRPQAALRALVVVANPSNLADYQPGGRSLAPVDVPGEVARAEAGLGTIASNVLASGGSATLEHIADQLRDGYDILYLVAHGALVRGEPRIWLEDADGKVAVVKGSDLVIRIQELQQRPRLVVLISCQSAGLGMSTDAGALSALGPRLAEAGIPAVIAMQGNFSMQTSAQFMATFFKELQRDGQIDRAMGVARGAVRDMFDWWMPVLFMRLKSGRIWYVPGFGDDGESFEKWPSLLSSIRHGQCTPILGAQLSATLLGSTQELAQRWAETYHFPLAPYQREDLPQVAQYLAVAQDSPQFPRDELLDYLYEELMQRYGANLPNISQDSSLIELVSAVGDQQRATNPADPYRVLAEMLFPIYITTDTTTLLSDALRAAGKDPQVELCRWNEDIEQLPSIYDDEPDYRPSIERPLVFHLFGTIEEPDSLVLTEDDYFDYLIGVSANKVLIPIAVREAITDKALLFLGFRLDGWNFRVLFRSLMSQEGGRRRKRYTHIAGQILPEEGRFLEPERARRYLDSYFQDADISIFWGSVEDFTKALAEQRDLEPARRGGRR